MSGEEGERVSPESEFKQALQMMEFISKATLEQMDKLMEMKVKQFEMIKELKSNEIYTNTTTDAEC